MSDDVDTGFSTRPSSRFSPSGCCDGSKAVAVGFGLAAILCGLAVEAQSLKGRNVGLWEIRMRSEGTDADAKSAEMAKRFANMTPAQKAQIERGIKERGFGMTMDSDGKPVTIMRTCVTPQDVAEEGALMKSLARDGKCSSKVLSQSPREVHIQAVCQGKENSSEIDAHISDIAADHYKVDMRMKNGVMHQEARWIGSDCGSIR